MARLLGVAGSEPAAAHQTNSTRLRLGALFAAVAVGTMVAAFALGGGGIGPGLAAHPLAHIASGELGDAEAVQAAVQGLAAQVDGLAEALRADGADVRGGAASTLQNLERLRDSIAELKWALEGGDNGGDGAGDGGAEGQPEQEQRAEEPAAAGGDGGIDVLGPEVRALEAARVCARPRAGYVATPPPLGRACRTSWTWSTAWRRAAGRTRSRSGRLARKRAGACPTSTTASTPPTCAPRSTSSTTAPRCTPAPTGWTASSPSSPTTSSPASSPPPSSRWRGGRWRPFSSRCCPTSPWTLSWCSWTATRRGRPSGRRSWSTRGACVCSGGSA